MSALPPRPDLDQLRRRAKERLRSARSGDPDAIAWIGEVGSGLTLAAAQLRLARDLGFTSWPALQLEVARRQLLDRHDPGELTELLRRSPELATRDLTNWSDHPLGASPLGYVAMARYDTVGGLWRDVEGTAAVAAALIAAGAPVDGGAHERETPLITAASYGDAEVAAVLIAAGADVDAVAAPDAGGVPGGSALLHAAVFGMTDVVDVLVAAGATIRSVEEAAAAGDLRGWVTADTPVEALKRSLVMAADHQRVATIDELVAAGTPVDEADAVFGRHPLRLAAVNGRPASIRALIGHGADPRRPGPDGRTPLDLCRSGRTGRADRTEHDEAEAALLEALDPT